MRALAIAAIVAAAVLLAACGPVAQNPMPPQPRASVSAPPSTVASPISPVPHSPPERPSHTATAAAGMTRVHDPRQVTGTEPAHCGYRDGGRLPDPHCTPGSIDPAVTQANIHSTICVSGYTKTVRPPESQTEAFKFDQAYPAYGVAGGTKTELDHLVSLELGGSNDASNLWPESPPTPNPKDATENRLHDAVCGGEVSLAAAQQVIATDWMTAESRLGIG